MIFIEKCKNPKAISLIIRAEPSMSLTDMSGRLRCNPGCFHGIEDKQYVAGGGAPEIELSLRLRDYANTVGDVFRWQLKHSRPHWK